jgi:hypothetical protein
MGYCVIVQLENFAIASVTDRQRWQPAAVSDFPSGSFHIHPVALR